MTRMKQISIDDILTQAEIDKAWKLYGKLKNTGQFNKALVTKFIKPNIERINKRIGQENDPSYLGYAVEYIFMRANSDAARILGKAKA